MCEWVRSAPRHIPGAFVTWQWKLYCNIVLFLICLFLLPAHSFTRSLSKTQTYVRQEQWNSVIWWLLFRLWQLEGCTCILLAHWTCLCVWSCLRSCTTRLCDRMCYALMSPTRMTWVLNLKKKNKKKTNNSQALSLHFVDVVTLVPCFFSDSRNSPS